LQQKAAVNQSARTLFHQVEYFRTIAPSDEMSSKRKNKVCTDSKQLVVFGPCMHHDVTYASMAEWTTLNLR